ncbi:MAG: nitrate- and nitrite sensing domain-containing protein, partial [Mariprofundaceae bacterium]
MRFLTDSPILIKVLLIVLAPLFMLGLFMLDGIQQAYRNQASMQTMLQAADLSRTVASLVSELQKERGMTAGFLGSSGRKFSGKLKLQRLAVNRAFSAYKVSAEKSMPLMDAFPALHTINDNFRQDMMHLKGIRHSVDKLNITVADELTYYIGLVDALMQTSNTIRVIYTFGNDSDNAPDAEQLITPNAIFSGLLSSFILLGRAGEAAGIERAVLSNTFGLGHFGPNMYERFVALVSRQQHALQAFSLQSSEPVRRIFSSIYTDEAVVEVERFRDIAMKKNPGDGFGVDPEQWFHVSTKRIELLQQIEGELVELINSHSRLGV